MTTPASEQKIIGAILAGGQSRRMGQDKALLSLNPDTLNPSTLNPGTSNPRTSPPQTLATNSSPTTTLLDLMISKLQELPVLDEVVVCRNERGFLQDIRPELGPLGALHTLSQHYSDSLILIVPVDMPLLSAKALTELLAHAEKTDVALYFEGYYFPLVLRFTKAVTQQLEHRLNNQDSDLSIARLLKDLNARKIIGDRDKLLFTNINTPEEWFALKQESKR